jgi:very-short-patch-repair endonuclease
MKMPSYRHVPSYDTKPEEAFRAICWELEDEGVITNLRSQYYIGYRTESGKVVEYVVDFVLNSYLVVEIKGRKWHSKFRQQRKDELKAQRIGKYGFRYMAFWDDEVLKNRGWVKDQVRAKLKEMESQL